VVQVNDQDQRLEALTCAECSCDAGGESGVGWVVTDVYYYVFRLIGDKSSAMIERALGPLL